MRAEAALLPRGVRVVCSGGRPGRAYDEARRLLGEGASALLSFGIAGGLDPALATGALVIGTAVVVGDKMIMCDQRWVESLRVALSPPYQPSPLKGEGEGTKGVTTGPIFGAAQAVVYPAEKTALHRRWQALTVDLESSGVARACAETGKPFAVLRAVADPAMRAIPRSALVGLTAAGRMNPFAVGRGLLARPGDLPGLMKLGRETRIALRALADAARRLGPTLGFETLAPLVDE
jgi:hypothetical protein